MIFKEKYFLIKEVNYNLEKRRILILDEQPARWGSKNYHKVKDLYYSAFPEWERFSWFSMVLMSFRRKLKLNAVYDGETFCGMICYYISDSTVYLAYLAVTAELRGNGYGSKILHMLEEKYPEQQIVLDIEPLDPDAENYHQRVSRLRFYQKNGWRRTHQMLIDADGEVEVLVDQNHFDKKDFAKTLKQMSLGFYRFRIEK